MFSLHIRDQLHPAVAVLLERLSSRRDEIVSDMLAALRREVAAYRAAEGDELVRLRTHCADHVDAFLTTARTGQAPRGGAVEFVRTAGERGARDGVELEILLRGYRTNATTLTHWIGEQANATTPAGLRAALAVTRMMMEYTDSISSALAEAYLHESRRLLAEAGSAQRDLLEDLLAGRSGVLIETGARLAGLEPGVALQVAVASAGDLGRAAEAVDHQLRMARVTGLRVVRHDELVVVVPAEASLRQLLDRAAAREPLAAGISLPVTALSAIPRAHREARRALALATPGRILRLADLTLLDYLLASADDTARRLGPSGLERLEAPLRETVLAFAASDLNMGATARRLHLHPTPCTTGCDRSSGSPVVTCAALLTWWTWWRPCGFGLNDTLAGAGRPSGGGRHQLADPTEDAVEHGDELSQLLRRDVAKQGCAKPSWSRSVAAATSAPQFNPMTNVWGRPVP